MRKTCLDLVRQLAQSDERIVFIGSDLGAGTLDGMRAEAPDRFYMEGISEAHVVGMAAGLALEGNIVYVNTIATFLTRRCFEQVALDLCLHKANVRLIGSGGGLVYAPLGPTHEAIDDVAIMRALPNMTIVAPADASEMRRLMPATVSHAGPMYIRLAKGGDPVVTDQSADFVIGKAYAMRDGSDALIVTTGITLRIALEAAELLKTQGLSAAVLHVPTIKPLDVSTLLGIAARVPVIVTVEEHTIIGGLGSAVAEAVSEANFDSPKRFRRIGVPDMFPDDYGSQESLLARFGITPAEIAIVIQQLVGQPKAV